MVGGGVPTCLYYCFVLCRNLKKKKGKQAECITIIANPIYTTPNFRSLLFDDKTDIAELYIH